MHSSFGLPYPAGHWFYSLQDLLDNPVFMVSFFVFWVTTVHLLLGAVYRKFNISEAVEIVIIFFIRGTNNFVFLSLCNIKGFSLKYKNWLKDKGRNFFYLFVLLNGELVHHEVNESELL